MTEKRFIELMRDEETDWCGDNAIQGLMIIAKYIDPSQKTILVGANHDIIYSVNIEELIKKDITEEDVIALRKLNWMVEDNSYLACFV